MTQEEYQDNIAEIHYPFIKEPIKLIIPKEIIASIGKGNMKSAGALVMGDALQCTIGDYMLELTTWNEKERKEQEERQAYMNERGYALQRKYEELEEQQILEEAADFRRWKEERQKKT